MANPEYKLDIGRETFFLWLKGNNSSIINTMETKKFIVYLRTIQMQLD